MLIRHACGHEREWHALTSPILTDYDLQLRVCDHCEALGMARNFFADERRERMATSIACALAERYVYGSPAHLDQWAATAVKMADRLVEELEKPR